MFKIMYSKQHYVTILGVVLAVGRESRSATS